VILVLGAFGGALAFAFKKLRPLFRERGEIVANLTGRLGESLGGIRIVKAYTAEKREQLTFARGAHTLFRNIAKSMTGVSATMAFSSLVVGAVGVVMILIGGPSVVSGAMTIGDLFMYVLFTGLLALPMIQFASIGTQMTEAFAGLDRIREVMSMATEDEEDAKRDALPDVQGEVEFQNVSFEYNKDKPADQPGDELQ
jgi:subfamily B ATP-binding cassette protein MsbA